MVFNSLVHCLWYFRHYSRYNNVKEPVFAIISGHLNCQCPQLMQKLRRFGHRRSQTAGQKRAHTHRLQTNY